MLAHRIDAVGEEGLAVHEIGSLDQERHVRARPGRELHQDRSGPTPEIQQFCAAAGHLDRAPARNVRPAAQEPHDTHARKTRVQRAVEGRRLHASGAAEPCVRPLLVLLLFAVPAGAQQFTYRGFAEVQSTGYVQAAPQDDDRVLTEALFRLEPAYRPVDWLTLSGSIDARIDSAEQVERVWRIDVRDRGLQRP